MTYWLYTATFRCYFNSTDVSSTICHRRPNRSESCTSLGRRRNAVWRLPCAANFPRTVPCLECPRSDARWH